MNKNEREEFEAAFNEDQAAASEGSDFVEPTDEPSDIDPEGGESGPEVVLDATAPLTEAQDEAATATAMAPPAEAVPVEGEGETAPTPVAAASGGEAVDLAKETQRLKSWEGRLRAWEAKLKDQKSAPAVDGAGAPALSAGGEIEQAALPLDGAPENPAETPAEAPPAEAPAAPAAAPSIDASEAARQLAADFGDDFVALIQAVASNAAEQSASGALAPLSQIQSVVDEIVADIVDTKSRAHFNAIEAAHPGFEQTVESPDFSAWLASLPDAERTQAEQIAEEGEAPEVIKLIDAFVASRAPLAEDDPHAGMHNDGGAPPAEDDWVDAAEGVRSGGAVRLPEPPGAAEDYASAWDDFK